MPVITMRYKVSPIRQCVRDMSTVSGKPVVSSWDWDDTPSYAPPPDSYTAFIEKQSKIINWDEYYRQVIESGGFYVDPKTSNNICFGITPYEFNPDDETDICLNLSSFAVDTFNHKRFSFQDPHGELQFIALLNATTEARINGLRFHLTFEAKNLDTGITSTYQAIVWKDSALEVLAFRLKPNPGSTEACFWSRRNPAFGEKDEKKSGEGVSKVPEPPTNEVLEEFVVNNNVACSVIGDCLTKRIHGVTGVSFGLDDCKSDPSKQIIRLSGTVEQLKMARPFVRESIRQFQNYYDGGDFETMANYRCSVPYTKFEE